MLKDGSQSSKGYVLAQASGHREDSKSLRVRELAMAALLANLSPASSLHFADELTNLHRIATVAEHASVATYVSTGRPCRGSRRFGAQDRGD